MINKNFNLLLWWTLNFKSSILSTGENQVLLVANIAGDENPALEYQ